MVARISEPRERLTSSHETGARPNGNVYSPKIIQRNIEQAERQLGLKLKRYDIGFSIDARVIFTRGNIGHLSAVRRPDRRVLRWSVVGDRRSVLLTALTTVARGGRILSDPHAPMQT